MTLLLLAQDVGVIKSPDSFHPRSFTVRRSFKKVNGTATDVEIVITLQCNEWASPNGFTTAQPLPALTGDNQ
jgi:hypothetical protein